MLQQNCHACYISKLYITGCMTAPNLKISRTQLGSVKSSAATVIIHTICIVPLKNTTTVSIHFIEFYSIITLYYIRRQPIALHITMLQFE